MGEIKSAIELAMERTKGLVMDEKEKEEAAAKELGLRVGGLLRRYFEDMIYWDDFRKEYGKLEGKKAQKNEALIDLALGEFDLSDDNEKVFEVLSFAVGDVDESLRKEIEALQLEFHEKMGAEVAAVTGSVTARLEEIGISGDAVEPNITEWEEWKSAVEQTKAFFRKRLAEWKNRVRALHR